MIKFKKITVILLSIIIISSMIIFLNYKNINQFTGADRKNYNIYKSDDLHMRTEGKKLEDTTNLKIMSYNIRRGKDLNDKYTMDEIINFLEESDIDIICLQEVLFSQNTLIRERTKYQSQFAANITIPIASTGLGIYSKHPVIESNHIILSSKTEPRGILHTVYQIDDKLVNVINLHLGLDKKERKRQINEIVEYTKSLEGDVILAGDFNERDLEIESFRDIGKYHGYEKYNTFIPTNSRIDYIFMSTDSMYSTDYEIVDVDLSDHYPIKTNIRYKP